MYRCRRNSIRIPLLAEVVINDLFQHLPDLASQRDVPAIPAERKILDRIKIVLCGQRGVPAEPAPVFSFL